MKIYSHISSGKYHPVHGEDHLFYEQLTDDIVVAAVMDGCSSGTESHFASASYVKSLRKACKMLPNMKEIFPEMSLERMTEEDIGVYLLKQLFEDMKKLKRMYFLAGFTSLGGYLNRSSLPTTALLSYCITRSLLNDMIRRIEEILKVIGRYWECATGHIHDRGATKEG